MNDQQEGTETKDEAQKIASEGTDIRENIRSLVVQTLKKSKNGLEELSKLADEVLDGAIAAVDQAVPEDRESVLRQTFDGLLDASSTCANAMGLAFEEAKQRGETFAKEDLTKAIDELKGAEDKFFSSIEELAKRSTSEIGSQLNSFVEHARQTGTSIRPSVETALKAAKSHPGKLATETAAAGAVLSRQAAGQFLYSVSTMLETAGDLLSGKTSDEE